MGSAFALGGTGTPALTLRDSTVTVAPLAPTTTTTGLFAITGMTGTSASITASGVTNVQVGVNVAVATFRCISGTISVDMRDSVFTLDIVNTGAAVTTFLYGSLGATVSGTPDIQWSVGDCEHTLVNVVAGISPPAMSIIAALAGFSFAPLAMSRFIVRDSLFAYENYPAVAPISSASDVATTAGGFIHMHGNDWLGVTTTAPATTTYVPPAVAGSRPITYDAVSQSGSSVFSGGLQTGVTALPGTTTTYTVVDGDAFIVWTTAAVSTLTLTASTVFVGKVVSVYNAGTQNIVVSCGRPANGSRVAAGGSLLSRRATAPRGSWWPTTRACSTRYRRPSG